MTAVLVVLAVLAVLEVASPALTFAALAAHTHIRNGGADR